MTEHTLGPLQQFVGEWQTEGTMLAGSGMAGVRFTAEDSYELVPGGRFLLHRWDAQMPDGRNQGIEVLGRARDGDGYFLHSYDASGSTGQMSASLEGDTWTFVGDTMRFRGRFAPGGAIVTGTWELHNGGEDSWVPWMSVRLTKKPDSPSEH